MCRRRQKQQLIDSMACGATGRPEANYAKRQFIDSMGWMAARKAIHEIRAYANSHKRQFIDSMGWGAKIPPGSQFIGFAGFGKSRRRIWPDERRIFPDKRRILPYVLRGAPNS